MGDEQNPAPLRIVLDDRTLLGMYAKALGFDVPTRAQRAIYNELAGYTPDGSRPLKEDTRAR